MINLSLLIISLAPFRPTPCSITLGQRGPVILLVLVMEVTHFTELSASPETRPHSLRTYSNEVKPNRTTENFRPHFPFLDMNATTTWTMSTVRVMYNTRPRGHQNRSRRCGMDEAHNLPIFDR